MINLLFGAFATIVTIIMLIQLKKKVEYAKTIRPDEVPKAYYINASIFMLIWVLIITALIYDSVRG